MLYSGVIVDGISNHTLRGDSGGNDRRRMRIGRGGGRQEHT